MWIKPLSVIGLLAAPCITPIAPSWRTGFVHGWRNIEGRCPYSVIDGRAAGLLADYVHGHWAGRLARRWAWGWL